MNGEIIAKLNSATKYPSIPTYHCLGDKGVLLDEVQVDFTERVIATEKIDGANSRLIVLPNGWFIGSREEMLTYCSDVIYNPTLGIVDTIKRHMNYLIGLVASHLTDDTIIVVYCETYGKGIQDWKQYTSKDEKGLKVFDIAAIPRDILAKPIEEISKWRDNGGQDFWKWGDWSSVPVIGEGLELPTGIQETSGWLDNLIMETKASLDGTKGAPEGVVVRTPDRSKIAKIKFRDYQRTLKALQQSKNSLRTNHQSARLRIRRNHDDR